MVSLWYPYVAPVYIPEVWGPGALGAATKAKHLPEDLRHSDPGEYDQVPWASVPDLVAVENAVDLVVEFYRSAAWGFQGFGVGKHGTERMNSVSQRDTCQSHKSHKTLSQRQRRRFLELRTNRAVFCISCLGLFGLDHRKSAVTDRRWSCHAALTGTEASEGRFDQDGCGRLPVTGDRALGIPKPSIRASCVGSGWDKVICIGLWRYFFGG